MAGAESMTASEVVAWLRFDEGAGLVREGLRWLVAELMEAEVSELIGARRASARTTGRRIAMAIERGAGTRAPGRIELQIPKIRQGSYFPSFLEPRRRSEQALVAVVQQA